MARVWILVAESSRARLLEMQRPGGALQELETLSHPESRLHNQAITSDLPGRTFDSAGQGRHVKEEPTEPKRYEAQEFARRLADKLDTARAQNRFDRLVLIAPPAFLGLLREALSETSRKQVTTEIDKNLVQHGLEEIRAHLPERL